MSDVRAIFWNGEPVEQIPALSRGLHYGDGVFRTLLLHDGRLVAADAQLAKLAADAAVLGIAPPDIATLRQDLSRVTGFGRAAIKLMLIRAGHHRGYAPSSDSADRLLTVHPLPDMPPARATDGIAAIRSPVSMAAQPLLAGIKHLNRLEQVLASRDWPDGISEAILGDDRGVPLCGTRSNLFWVRNGTLHTPMLDRAGVAGVTRSRVLALAEAEGIECRIGNQPWSSLQAADEAFITGSLIGIWPLKTLDTHHYPSRRALTQRLQVLLDHPVSRDADAR